MKTSRALTVPLHVFFSELVSDSDVDVDLEGGPLWPGNHSQLPGA
jgi:hypothetical protein